MTDGLRASLGRLDGSVRGAGSLCPSDRRGGHDRHARIEATGIVTDVSLFLNLLAQRLAGDTSSGT